jgi:hypothetical protein
MVEDVLNTIFKAAEAGQRILHDEKHPPMVEEKINARQARKLGASTSFDH